MVQMRFHEPKTVDPDDYDAEFTHTEEVKTRYGRGMKWWFTIENDPEYDGEKVSGMTDIKITSANKSGKWFMGLGANVDDFREGDLIDPDKYTGTKVRVTIENTSDGDNVFSNVTDVRSLGRRRAQDQDRDRRDDRDRDRRDDRDQARDRDRRDDRDQARDRDRRDDRDQARDRDRRDDRDQNRDRDRRDDRDRDRRDDRDQARDRDRRDDRDQARDRDRRDDRDQARDRDRRDDRDRDDDQSDPRRNSGGSGDDLPF